MVGTLLCCCLNEISRMSVWRLCKNAGQHPQGPHHTYFTTISHTTCSSPQLQLTQEFLTAQEWLLKKKRLISALPVHQTTSLFSVCGSTSTLWFQLSKFKISQCTLGTIKHFSAGALTGSTRRFTELFVLSSLPQHLPSATKLPLWFVLETMAVVSVKCQFW